VREAFSNALVRLALADPKVLLLTGDHGYTLFDGLRRACPHVPEEELVRRMEARNRHRDPNDVPITVGQLREYLPRFERPTEEEMAGWRALR
jgi:hypothetical protein